MSKPNNRALAISNCVVVEVLMDLLPDTDKKLIILCGVEISKKQVVLDPEEALQTIAGAGAVLFEELAAMGISDTEMVGFMHQENNRRFIADTLSNAGVPYEYTDEEATQTLAELYLEFTTDSVINMPGGDA